ncbi:hypothetical protein [Pseudoduganella namucuonensis]|uniref:DUF4189 domain-containing protein n=1 Tax=Pseudoduganella namucuonensis TaxID=1035707 RepID=A0A1I7LYE0_9BURK|nr:hypothetical protein [Pseudoduganella namucuonensis]SFV14610.1 hypothetical protein SAMN05216552_10437 [Pseudoduganella namucuonensis]
MKKSVFNAACLMLALSGCASAQAPSPAPASAIGSAAGAAPGAAGRAANEAADKAASAPLERLRAMSAAATCSSAEQCRTVPVGVKACGGPEGYLPVSASQAGEASALARRHREQRIAADAARAAAGVEVPRSNCMMVMDPGATCQAGLCRLQPGGQGGRAD